MSDIELTTVARDDLGDYLVTMRRLFGQAPDPTAPHVAELLARSTLVRLDGEDAGTGAVLDLSLTLPGGATVSMDGVTIIVVAPVARRRGILRALMNRLLDDARERGAPVLGLGATESSIYRRFGYGLASYNGRASIETAHAGFRVPVEDGGRLRAVALDDAERVWSEVDGRWAGPPGRISRAPAVWRRVIANAARSDEQGVLQVVAHHDGAGVVDGFVNYRQELRWREEVADGVVRVKQLVALNRSAHFALWRHVLELDLCEHLEMDRFWLDEPVQHLLTDPRRLRVLPVDDLHLRVVDPVAMLAARRYSREDSVVIEVHDDACSDVAGRYRVEGGLAGADAARTDAAADLVLDAAGLGSILLGGVSVAALHAAGAVEEKRDGAVRRASAMFAWSPRPHLTYMF